MPPTGERSIVLLGMGHTNTLVLRRWRAAPVLGARLTCISDFPTATYSGMLPGVLAEQYTARQMTIDLAGNCERARAEWVLSDVTGADWEDSQLLFADRPPLPFDVLSIGVGSRPDMGPLGGTADRCLPIKPMQTFLTRLRRSLAACQPLTRRRPLRVAVVGGGAAGVEIALCLPPFVRQVLGPVGVEMTLFEANPRLLRGMLARTVARIDRRLEAHHIRRELGARVERVVGDQLVLRDGRQIRADVILCATGATAPPLLEKIGLNHDERGFLVTRRTLQSVEEDRVFVVGDCGSLQSMCVPKAGVFAVRQAPLVWQNIARYLDGRPLQLFTPQQRFLKLLNMGDGSAVGEYRN